MRIDGPALGIQDCIYTGYSLSFAIGNPILIAYVSFLKIGKNSILIKIQSNKRSQLLD